MGLPAEFPTYPGAYTEIDLGALSHNLRVVRKIVPDAKVMAVVKANAYGHGLLGIARSLSSAGIDAFAVARYDEGIALRQANIHQRIAVLQGFVLPDELRLMARYRLEPVIHSLWQIDQLAGLAEHEKISVWLKLDTGMQRLGLNAEEFTQAWSRLGEIAALQWPIPIMTHLANADDLTDQKTSQQLNYFAQWAGDLADQRSIANSAGILGWQDAHAEWIRPGIMLYGASPFPDRNGPDEGLRPVMTLKSRLIAIKPVAASVSVGYGGGYVTPRSTRLGIAALGYGDGYPRHARTGTPLLVNGQRVPLVGRVSMDMITLDLNAQPDAQVGNTVTAWGSGLPVEEIAACADTIPYTLLCGVTPRVRVEEIHHRN